MIVKQFYCSSNLRKFLAYYKINPEVVLSLIWKGQWQLQLTKIFSLVEILKFASKPSSQYWELRGDVVLSWNQANGKKFGMP